MRIDTLSVIDQLRNAAKAARYEVTEKHGVCKGGDFVGFFIGDKPWEPHNDDGDSRRLEVRLRLTVQFFPKDLAAMWFYKSQAKSWSKFCTGDIDADVRSVVLLAASEIGRRNLNV